MTGPADDARPEQVPRHRKRYVALVAPGLLVVLGAGVAVVGLVAPLGAGERRSAFPVVFGVELLVLGGAGVVALWPGRQRPLPPARTEGGAVLLPLRTSYLLAAVAGLVDVAALGVTVRGQTIAWADVVTLVTVFRHQPVLLLGSVSDAGARPLRVALSAQAWPPELVVQALERYRTPAELDVLRQHAGR